MSENTEHLVGAVKFLDDAKNEMIDRAKTYDSPGGEKSMGKAIIALNAIAGEDIARTGMRECHGWLLMSLIKSVRQYSRSKPHLDSAVDKVAYSALEAEARMDELEEPSMQSGVQAAWSAAIGKELPAMEPASSEVVTLLGDMYR